MSEVGWTLQEVTGVGVFAQVRWPVEGDVVVGGTVSFRGLVEVEPTAEQLRGAAERGIEAETTVMGAATGVVIKMDATVPGHGRTTRGVLGPLGDSYPLFHDGKCWMTSMAYRRKSR